MEMTKVKEAGVYSLEELTSQFLEELREINMSVKDISERIERLESIGRILHCHLSDDMK